MAEDKNKAANQAGAPVRTGLWLAGFLLAAVLTGYYIFRAHRNAVLRETEDLLGSVARLKAEDIVRWREERSGDLLALSRSPLMLAALKSTMAGGPGRKDLSERLRRFIEAKHYSAVVIITPSGKVLAEAGDPHRLSPDELKSLTDGLRNETDARLGELFFCPQHIKVHMRMSSGFFSGGRMLAVLVLRREPEGYLFPMIQKWPGVSATAETLLVERRGDRVMFLNDLRHKKDAAVRFSVEMRPDLPAANALTNPEDFFIGIDYRGVKVYSYTLRVPGSRWGLVSKIDAAEVNAKARSGLLLALLLALLVLGSGAYGAYLLIRRHSQAVEKLSARYAAALSDSSETMTLLELDSRRLVEINPASLRMYGYSREEFLGLRADDMRPPELRAQLGDIFARLRTGKTMAYRTVHLKKDGTRFPVEVSLRLVELEGKEYAHAIIRDITEKERLLELDRLENQRLQALVKLGQMGEAGEAALLDAALEEVLKITGSRIGYIYSYSEEKKLFTLNSWSRDVMKTCAVTAQQTVYELDKTGLWGEVVRQRKGLIVNDYQAPSPLKKGCPEGHAALSRWMSVPVFIAGKIVAVLGVSNKAGPYSEDELIAAGKYIDDVWKLVEARRAAARLKEAEERIETAVKNLPGAVYRCLDDADWTMEYLSPGIGELTGYRPEDFISRRVSYASLVPEEDRRMIQGQIAAALAEGKPFLLNYRLRKADGRIIWVWEHGRIAADPGPQRKLDGYITDITPLKMAELERERLGMELAAKNKELEEFLYVTTHDLRSPLVNIQGFGENIAAYTEELRRGLTVPTERYKTLLEEKIPVALGYITESAAKMDRLIKTLLQISRAGRSVPKKERVDMNALLAQIGSYFAFALENDGGRLELGPLPPCVGDRDQINQVFSNLIDNAVKYRDRTRPLLVKVSGASRDGRVVYEVRDNGIGLEASQLGKIWKVFYRVSVKPGVPGEGLGLALVRVLLDRNSGAVSVESVPGEGSVFRVELPEA